MSIPCLHAVWAKWSPPFERSRMVSTAVAGSFAGKVNTEYTSLCEKFQEQSEAHL